MMISHTLSRVQHHEFWAMVAIILLPWRESIDLHTCLGRLSGQPDDVMTMVMRATICACTFTGIQVEYGARAGCLYYTK